MYDVTSIGNPVYDIIITPFVRTRERVLSGCSTNSALTVGKLGGSAALVGKIGDDFRDDFLRVTKMYNVSAFPLSSENTGGFYLRYLDEKMTDRELRILGIADKIRFEDMPLESLNTKSIILGPILKEIDLEFVKNLVEELDDVFIFVDPQGLIREIVDNRIVRIANKDVYKVMELTHITKPNEHEAEVLFPNMEPAKIAMRIFKLNRFAGIVTVAERGSYIAYEGGLYHIPAFRTIERDPTGCGDVYAGAFMYYYLRYGDLLESAIFASAAASFMVEDTGPHFKVDKNQVMMRFEKIQEGVKRL